MNVSQKSLTYIGKFADEIKRIKDGNRFLMDCTSLSENEKKNGVWERVISESVMAINHFEHWKKQPKDMCDYLNSNSSIDEFKGIERYFNRLIPYTDKLSNRELAALFTAKNLFIWMMLFDKFTKMNISDDKFVQFLNAFVTELQYKKVNGENWVDIDGDRHTKDRSLIERKIDHLEYLLREFLSSVNMQEEENSVEFVIADCLGIDIKTIQEDMDLYNESLDILLENTVKVDSKLRNEQNRSSLLAMMVYSYRKLPVYFK